MDTLDFLEALEMPQRAQEDHKGTSHRTVQRTRVALVAVRTRRSIGHSFERSVHDAGSIHGGPFLSWPMIFHIISYQAKLKGRWRSYTS